MRCSLILATKALTLGLDGIGKISQNLGIWQLLTLTHVTPIKILNGIGL